MPEYLVYEVAKEAKYHRWLHEVEAESAEEALAKAQAGAAPEPCHCGEIGEPNEQYSGWAVRLKEPAPNEDEAWDEALQDCEDQKSMTTTRDATIENLTNKVRELATTRPETVYQPSPSGESFPPTQCSY